MANILLGVTGSVAAIRVPELYAALRQRKHAVKIVATKSAAYFFDPKAIEPTDSGTRNREVVILDEDEWPADRYRRGDDVLHIELRRWAGLLLVAPLDANTLAKFACGLSDNCLTCVWRAWDSSKPIVLAPAMNTLMWEHPLTIRHLRQIACDAGIEIPPDIQNSGQLIATINLQRRPLRIVAPEVKTLACGDTGIGAMASIENVISEAVNAIQSFPHASLPATGTSH